MFKFTRNVQSEFQVPLTLAGVAQAEPRAQYMWPRTNTSTENSTVFYHPEEYHDYNDMVNEIFGTSWYDSIRDEVWRTMLYIAWNCRYEITNLTNVDIHYEALTYKVRRDVSNLGTSTTSYGFQNPFNVVGMQLCAGQDTGAADASDATNVGLHTERIQLKYQPAWAHFYKEVRKHKFKLGPGKSKTFRLKKKGHVIKLLDIYQSVIVNQGTKPAATNCRKQGDVFMIFKMLSGAAGINDGIVGLAATSTRTIPVSLLAYQCNYIINKPNFAMISKFVALPSSGFGVPASIADIAVMGDDDFKEIPQAVVS